MKTIEINGKVFELDGTTNRDVVKQCSIYDVYGRPSERKRQIWYEWISWFMSAGIWEYGISSYNSNFFSINAIARNVNGKDYMLVITKMHDRAYEIV